MALLKTVNRIGIHKGNWRNGPAPKGGTPANPFYVEAPDGRVLEQFASEWAAIDWAKSTTDFLCRPARTPKTRRATHGGGGGAKTRAYGDKTDYPKIDVFVDGKYAISTTWVPTCREAVERYLERYPGTRGRVIASFDPRSRKRR